MMIPFKEVGLFGARYALNMVIRWVNHHEKQSEETIQFRKSAEGRIRSLEDRVSELESRSRDV